MWYEFNEEKTKVFIKHPRTIGHRWIRNEEVPDILKSLSEKHLTLTKIDKNGTHHYTTNTCYICNGNGQVIINREKYDCDKCHGTGKLEKTKLFKVHTREYGEGLEREYMKKQNQKFFDKYGINEDGLTYVYIGDTFSIKCELKEKGAKYNTILSRWMSKELIDNYDYIIVYIPLRTHKDKSIGFDFGYDEINSDIRINHLLDIVKDTIKEKERELNKK